MAIQKVQGEGPDSRGRSVRDLAQALDLTDWFEASDVRTAGPANTGAVHREAPFTDASVIKALEEDDWRPEQQVCGREESRERSV